MSTSPARVISTEDLPLTKAKWITLKELKYVDDHGQTRRWECAQRKTPVAIFAILRSRTNAFPPSTVIIEQYRPPVDKVVVGLVDANETPEEAAIRELHEETGYTATSVRESSPIIVCDPGMTNANMKLIVLDVDMADKLETPDQQLDAGEHIIRRVVSLDNLASELEGGFIVDARLFHFAAGYIIHKQLGASR
ncbi:hypothetical protein AMATHDRAFT_77332 [Amanita thiersii Skay4041]|uniref:Nudix hydrolase domain-containing protein n=1 Tax=Amanita thiersii Skay4041 TaxID=703135 RepID=A0A2A9NFZ7_9AGAR|nr:hypothetical protein AMATHDRAFT_77332 [Amanita thiersii Skay4041]